MAYPDVDPKHEALYQLEESALLPASGAARFLQAIAVVQILIAGYFIFSGDSDNFITAVIVLLSAGLVFSVASLYQNIFDIRTLMLRTAALRQTAPDDLTANGASNA